MATRRFTDAPDPDRGPIEEGGDGAEIKVDRDSPVYLMLGTMTIVREAGAILDAELEAGRRERPEIDTVTDDAVRWAITAALATLASFLSKEGAPEPDDNQGVASVEAGVKLVETYRSDDERADLRRWLSEYRELAVRDELPMSPSLLLAPGPLMLWSLGATPAEGVGKFSSSIDDMIDADPVAYSKMLDIAEREGGSL